MSSPNPVIVSCTVVSCPWCSLKDTFERISFFRASTKFGGKFSQRLGGGNIGCRDKNSSRDSMGFPKGNNNKGEENNNKGGGIVNIILTQENPPLYFTLALTAMFLSSHI